MSDSISGNSVAFLTTKQVADILDVSKQTVFNWIKNGKLKSRKVQHHRFIPVPVYAAYPAGEAPDPEAETVKIIVQLAGRMAEIPLDYKDAFGRPVDRSGAVHRANR